MSNSKHASIAVFAAMTATALVAGGMSLSASAEAVDNNTGQSNTSPYPMGQNKTQDDSMGGQVMQKMDSQSGYSKIKRYLLNSGAYRVGP